MLSFGGPTEATARDQQLYLSGRMVEVACLDCLARVTVKKNSDHQPNAAKERANTPRRNPATAAEKSCTLMPAV